MFIFSDLNTVLYQLDAPDEMLFRQNKEITDTVDSSEQKSIQN